MTAKISKLLLTGGEVVSSLGAGSSTLSVNDFNVFKTAITGGGDTLTLPVAGLSVGATYRIYDTGGTAGTDSITIDPTGATTINGTATVAIDSNYGNMTCVWTGTEWVAEISSTSSATNLVLGTLTGTTVDVNSSTGTNATILAADATNAGVMISADKIKLDAVETGATADQLAAEVPIADVGTLITATEVEGALQENRAAINLNTAKTSYPGVGAVDHDALLNFLANEHIDWTAATQDLNTTGEMHSGEVFITGGITITGTVDGRDVAADGTKLDWLTVTQAVDLDVVESDLVAVKAVRDNGSLMFNKTTTQVTTSSWADLTTFATPTIIGSDYSVNATTGVVTISTTGLYAVSYHLLGTNTVAGRAGFSARLRFDLGAGYGTQALTQSGSYARFNVAEPWAIATIPSFLFEFTAADLLKLQVIHTTNVLNVEGYISIKRID